MIEIKELRDFSGTIEQFISILQKYKRRYPGYTAKVVCDVGLIAFVELYPPEKKKEKPKKTFLYFEGEKHEMKEIKK